MDEAAEADAFAAAVLARLIGGMETLSIYVGDRLGLYRALVPAPLTARELSARTGMHERYAREWLEQQAVAGILEVIDLDSVDDATSGAGASGPAGAGAAAGPAGPADAPRFRLPPAYADVLADPSSLRFSSPLSRMLVAAATRLPDLLTAYRSGGGVGWAQFGDDARDAQGDQNRPWFERALGDALLAVPAVHDILSRPGARIADIGCGHGWSTIALARTYPHATVDGFDPDGPAVASARAHAEAIDNASFTELRGEQVPGDGSFDAAFVFEALHDMPDPVAVLRAVRRAVRADGAVVVMDEAVADAFTAPGDEIERVMYGYSLFICLPDSMSTPGSVATGTVMRRATLERYAREAGFAGVSVLPIEGFSAFRFYALDR